jgi:16S rRNA (guanine527-N7)-methyltransferase
MIESELEKFRIPLDTPQTVLLAKYCEELSRWNRKINLTSLSAEAMVRRLVIEPVWIGRELQIRKSLIDIGSGNGSPAIPLQVVCSLNSCRLVEVRAKRAAFLRHVIGALQLGNTVVSKDRFESLPKAIDPAEWVTLQAVSLTEGLVEAIRRVSSPTTTIVWITSPRTKTALDPSRVLSVPITGTQVSLYRLDLS